ncbi:MAG: hypothetical protein ACR2MN_17335 [Acidimicrobiales bacterium]
MRTAHQGTRTQGTHRPPPTATLIATAPSRHLPGPPRPTQEATHAGAGS